MAQNTTFLQRLEAGIKAFMTGSQDSPAEAKSKEILRLLDTEKHEQGTVESLYRERQVHVDAANAILVGAALIATVTYASWLLLPFADVSHTKAVVAFWVLNSFSFFFAIATLLIGACTAMPNFGHTHIEQLLQSVKIRLRFAVSFLIFSVLCVLGAFSSGAYVRIPPNLTILLINKGYVLAVVVIGVTCSIIAIVLFLVFWLMSPGFESSAN